MAPLELLQNFFLGVDRAVIQVENQGAAQNTRRQTRAQNQRQSRNQQGPQNQQDTRNEGADPINEIQQYQLARYISTNHAIWR